MKASLEELVRQLVGVVLEEEAELKDAGEPHVSVEIDAGAWERIVLYSRELQKKGVA